MQCLILAGGLGTRMKPATESVAKALIPVHGRPFADHQLTWLTAQGVGRVLYAIGRKGEQIRDFVGSGGAVRLAVDEGLVDDGFLVLYCDSYLSVDVKAVWAASEKGGHPLMCVFRNDGRWDASNAIFENGLVTRTEKGRTDAAEIGMAYIDYGLSVLTRDAVEAHVPSGEPYDLADVFGRLAEAGELRGFEATERFYEIGSPDGLADLEAQLAPGT
jgi:NDP-sugar pyrophosphorylase family protein